MSQNHSPWIHQLTRTEFFPTLSSDQETDVVVVGAGIAGVATAFFLLTDTDKKVVLIEAYKIARGATGHNAGQVVSYFERSFADIVSEFGLQKAGEAQKAIEDTWALLDLMYTQAGLDIPFARFVGHAGFCSYDQVLVHLKDSKARAEVGLLIETFRISESADFISQIPLEYKDLYTLVPREAVLSLLETEDTSFCAVLSYQKGCINSALFCEEVVGYLHATYGERLSVYENTPIQKVVLKHECALLDAGIHTIKAERVVLCTNGFENLRIINESGLDIDTKFHETIEGTIGYMSGYMEPLSKPPTAISYFIDPDLSLLDPYFYLTRRQYEYEGNTEFNLISVGGPELSVEDKYSYSHELLYPEEMGEKIDQFVRKTYETDSNKPITYEFTWHGLMGYTPNRIRRIGYEPKNHVLMYNIGCNGVGILPSIFGGKRIAGLLTGADTTMIFDPQ